MMPEHSTVLRFPSEPSAHRLRIKAAAAGRTDPILSLERQLWEADEAWSAASNTGDSEEAYERFKPLDERMRDAVPISLEGPST